MDADIIAVVIFIVAIIASIAQKIQEGRQARERQQRRAQQPPPELPEATRRQLSGEPAMREAQPRQARPRHVDTQEGPAKNLFDELFGEGKADNEGEWEPVHQPQPRREVPRQLQPREAPPRAPQRPLPQSPRPLPEAPRRMVVVEQRRAPETAVRPAKPPRVPSAPRAPEPAARRTHERALLRAEAFLKTPQGERDLIAAATAEGRRGPTRKPLFSEHDDVRRAILMREILGPPKGLQRPEDADGELFSARW